MSRDRRLVLVRHAKTEQAGAGDDHGRRLLPRGLADASAAAAWLAGEPDLLPDLVLCSSAVRAEQTWAAMARHPMLADVEVRVDRRIYNAPPEGVLEVLTETPEDALVVVVMGHAPGVPALVAALADPERSRRDAVAVLETGFPTMGCAVLEPGVGWADLAADTATLLAVEVPRGDGAEEQRPPGRRPFE